MKKYIKISAFLIVAICILSLNPVIAENAITKIEAVLNSVDLYINGERVAENSIVYNDVTYIPINAVSEMLNLDVELNSTDGRIDINDNDLLDDMADDKHRVEYCSPKIYENDAYLINNSTYVQFDDELNKKNDYSNIIFMDIKGNKINIKCSANNIEHKGFLYIVPEKLELDTYYTLFIPKDTVKFVNGDIYHEDIQMIFKTAENVLEGRINSTEDYKGASIILYNNDGYENTEYILENNRFYFTNIPAGVYSIKIGDAIFNNITVDSNKTNHVNLMKIE